MSDDMRAGLGLGLGPEPGLPMIPTYVENLPTGYVMLCSLPFWVAILVKVLDPTSIKNVKIRV